MDPVTNELIPSRDRDFSFQMMFYYFISVHICYIYYPTLHSSYKIIGVHY